jgi:RimJ/RimL family protein N-acetyltransferase
MRGVHVVLQTERMTLRRFTPDDVDAVLALDRDPLVRRYVEDGEPVNREATADLVAHWMSQYRRWDRFGFWAAIHRQSGAFLGWFHLRPRDASPADAPELGYRLTSSVWGHGYATEGSRALIDYAFATPGVERVLAETMVVHVASRRVMEKAGMHLVRTFRADWPVRIPGDEAGDVEYAITRTEWERAHRG